MDRESLKSAWTDRTVAGRFPLFEWIGSTEHGEVFRTEADGNPAAIQILPAESVDAPAQLEDWRAASEIPHPHLLRILEAGHGESESGEFLYAVTEFPEESLAQILPGRPLSDDEARQMLLPIIDALAFLHSKGRVHGNVQPGNILVAGDQLKLASFRLDRPGDIAPHDSREYIAPELTRGELSPATDMWPLGMTLVEALTQHLPQWSRNAAADPEIPRDVREPFAQIAACCLRRDPAQRCTLAQVRDMLEGRSMQPALEPERVATAVAPATMASAVEPLTASAVVAEETLDAGEEATVVDEEPPVIERPEVLPPVHVARVEESPREEIVAPAPPPRQAEFSFENGDPGHNTLRSFGNPDEEDDDDEGGSAGRWILAVVVLIALVIGVFYLRSHWPGLKSAEPEQQDASTSSAATNPAPAPAPAPASPNSAQNAFAGSASTPNGQGGNTAAPPNANPAGQNPAATNPAPSPQSTPAQPQAPATNPAPMEGQSNPERPAAEPKESRGPHGAVVRRVMPYVPSRIRRTMRGSVIVHIRAEVGRTGRVTRVRIEPGTHDRYFANLAEIAARQWRFRPPRVIGRSEPSTWSLRFEFRRNRTTAQATQVKP